MKLLKILINYPDIPWKEVKGIRDILSHHYFDLNAETIFDVCKEELTTLLDTTKQIIADIKNNT